MMKVRESCYTGTLKDTPMKITKGMSASDIAIPGVGQSYFAMGNGQAVVREQAGSSKSKCVPTYPTG